MSEIISIGLEAGNTSEFTGVDADCTAAAAAALAGTDYGLSCYIDDNNPSYGYKQITANTSGQFRARVYIDINTLSMANNNDFYFLRFLNSSSLGVANVRVYITSGVYKIRFTHLTDAGSEVAMTGVTISDEPHYIEVHLVRATNSSSADGTYTAWIDGTQVGQQTGIDNYDRFPNLYIVQMGSCSGIDSGTRGTWYIDELVVNDDGSEIGPVGGGGTEYTQAVSGTLTSAGTVVKQGAKLAAGTLTSAGALIRQMGKSLAGAISPGGGLAKQANKNVAGSLSTAGTLNQFKVALISLAGALGLAGILGKQSGKNAAGTLGSSGALVKQSAKLAAGGLATSGIVNKSTAKSLGGAISPAGALATVKAALVSLAGALGLAGALAKQTAKTVSGALPSSGSISKTIGKIVAGGLSGTGSISKAISKGIGGALGLAGYLAAAGSVAVEGIIALTARARSAATSAMSRIASQAQEDSEATEKRDNRASQAQERSSSSTRKK